MTKNVAVIGATSGLCHEAARNWAKKGYKLKLVARSEIKLKALEADLVSHGATDVEVFVYDLLKYELHEQLVSSLFCEPVDILLIGHGTLSDQELAKTDFDIARLEIESNYLSFVSLLTKFLPKFKNQAFGSIGVITSVAGDRGRKSNYVYGSSKAGTTAFVDGFRAECAEFGVKVTTIKPGIVRTAMTAHFSLDGPVISEPGPVGRDIVKAMEKGYRVFYTPFLWRIIMAIVKNIPSIIFDKSKF